MLIASIITRTSEFAALRDEWYDLIQRSTSATIFDTFEWQFTWWSKFGKKVVGAKLFIVLLRDADGELSGIAPFYSCFWPCWPIVALRFLGAGLSDYHDVIAADGNEAAVSDCLFQFLYSGKFWKIADFAQLRPGSHLMRNDGVKSSPHFEIAVLRQEECPYLEIPNSGGEERWDALLAGYSKKMRGHIRYSNRLLDRLYVVDRTVAGDAEEVNEGMEALFSLHQRRWNSRWLPGVFYSRTVRDFHRMVALQMLERGWLRLHLLRLDHTIEAALYCFSINRVTYYYQGGFEPTFSKFSLGTVVTSLAVKKSVLDGDCKFDFLRGNEPYKLHWTKGSSAVNTRWLIGREGLILFGMIAKVVRFQLRIELKLKKWLHQRNHGRDVATPERTEV